ncbi:CYIR protein, partial [Plasmodium cynomolgi strain B]
DLDRSKIRDVISENNSYNNVKCTSDDLSEYEQLKKKGLNDLEIYKEQFKSKYPKRKVPILALSGEKIIPPEFKMLPTVRTRLNYAFFIPYCTIFILIIFYIFIKVVKYHRLEDGTGKLNFK